MKILKYTLFTFSGLILLAGAVLAYIAATFDPNQYKPQIVQAVKDKTQRTLKLEGNIGLSFWPNIGAKIGKASLSERASNKEFAALEELRVSLQLLPLLSGQAIVDTVRLGGLRASIVKAKDGKTNIDDLTSPSSAKEVAPAKDARSDFKVDIAGVEIINATINYADAAAGTKYVLSKLNFKTGRLAPGVPTNVEFSVHLQGDQPKIDLPVALKTRMTFNPEKKSLTLADLALEAKGAAAGLSGLAVKLTGSADIDGAKEHIRTSLAGKLVDSSVKARLDIAGFATPTYNFDVEIDQIDLDRYLPQPAGGGSSPGAARQPEKEQPFDLSALRGLRAAGTLKVGAFKANNVKVSNLRIDLKANGGHVDLNPLTANFYEGTLTSAIAINAAQNVPAFTIRHNMKGINAGLFLKDLANNDKLEGKGDVMLNVTTYGNTVSALKKSLNGNADVKLADGAVRGIDIAGSIRNAKAKLGALGGEQTQASDQNQKTGFSELTATFKITNGVAYNNDLSLKSPLLRVGGAGEINIGADSLNYLVKASIVATSKGQGGRDTDDLRGITVPVRVSGPLAAPSYKLDFGATAKNAVKQAITDQLQKSLGGGAAATDPAKKNAASPGTSTRDKLKGLFGR